MRCGDWADWRTLWDSEGNSLQPTLNPHAALTEETGKEEQEQEKWEGMKGRGMRLAVAEERLAGERLIVQSRSVHRLRQQVARMMQGPQLTPWLSSERAVTGGSGSNPRPDERPGVCECKVRFKRCGV